jgi:beta-phosphoglucomutase-like phosphatase (HAD superfamily)
MSTKKQLPIIISDIDGVVCNLMEQVTLAIWQDYGILVPQEYCLQYNVGRGLYRYVKEVFDSPVSFNRYLVGRVYLNSEVLKAAKPYYDVLERYQNYRGRPGSCLMFFTSRSARRPTEAWFDSWLYGVPVLFTWSKAKWLYLNIDGLRRAEEEIWVIDDNPADLRALAKVKDPLNKLRVMRMPQPWNDANIPGAEGSPLLELDKILCRKS